MDGDELTNNNDNSTRTLRIIFIMAIVMMVIMVLSFISLILSMFYPRIHEAAVWLLLIWNLVVLFFMMYSKEVQLGTDFYKLPKALIWAWWGAFALNVFISVKNFFELVGMVLK